MGLGFQASRILCQIAFSAPQCTNFPFAPPILHQTAGGGELSAVFIKRMETYGQFSKFGSFLGSLNKMGRLITRTPNKAII